MLSYTDAAKNVVEIMISVFTMYVLPVTAHCSELLSYIVVIVDSLCHTA